MKLVYFIGLMCLVMGQIKSQGHSKDDPPRRYCGKFLSNHLRLLCDSKYYGGFSKKNIPMIGANDDEDYQYEQPEDDQTWPFLSSEMANSLIAGSSKRQFGGIVDECCKKPCTLNEMIEYCGK